MWCRVNAATAGKSRREESRRPTGQSGEGAHLVQPQSHGIALCREQALTPIKTLFVGDALPERTQLVDAYLRRIAGDQRAIDGADRNAGDPIGMKIRLCQCLIDTGLIGAECTTPLEQERDALERRTRSRPRSHIAA